MRTAHSLASIVYAGVLVAARAAFITAFVATGNLYLVYLTNQVYVLASLTYVLLFAYALGVRLLRPLLFGLLLPVLFVLQFCVLVLLWGVILFNPALFADSINNGLVTIGQLYVGDHILHVLPFIDVVIVAFVFGRESARFAQRLATASLRCGCGHVDSGRATAGTAFYDVHTGTHRCTSSSASSRRWHATGGRALRLAHAYVVLHVLYAVLVPFGVIFTYTRVFDATLIYGELPFPQWALDLCVLGACAIGELIFAAICTYAASLSPPPRLSRGIKLGGRVQYK